MRPPTATAPDESADGRSAIRVVVQSSQRRVVDVQHRVVECPLEALFVDLFRPHLAHGRFPATGAFSGVLEPRIQDLDAPGVRQVEIRIIDHDRVGRGAGVHRPCRLGGQ